MPHDIVSQGITIIRDIERLETKVFVSAVGLATGTTVVSDTLSYRFVRLDVDREQLGWLQLAEKSLAEDWGRPEDAIYDTL